MQKNIQELPSALQSREELDSRFKGRRLALFLDYDGTLTPIVDKPDMAAISDDMKKIVRSLAERHTVVVVSGRDRQDVERLVGLDKIVYAGSHGFDIAGPGGKSVRREMGTDFFCLLAQVKERLARELEDIKGALIDPKKASIAVHYRLARPGDAEKVKDIVDAILYDHGELRVTSGKMVYEIQPRVDWDKGKAVLWLITALNLDGPDLLPIYLGDDITDEDAFLALKQKGVGIFVGRPGGERGYLPTYADYFLKDTDEVASFLKTV